jgi:hypothetical protein
MRCKHPQRGCDRIAMNSCGRVDGVSITWKHINTPEYFAAAARLLCASISSASSSQKFRKRFAPGKQGVHGDEMHRKMECKIWREIELGQYLWYRAPVCQAVQKAALNPVVTADQLLRTGHWSHATPHVTRLLQRIQRAQRRWHAARGENKRDGHITQLKRYAAAINRQRLAVAVEGEDSSGRGGYADLRKAV